MIDRTAIVDGEAELGEGVTVGPYSIIGPRVKVGANTIVHAHVILDGDTVLGPECEVHPFAVLGTVPQDRKDRRAGKLRIGSRNVFREHVTVHVGANGGTTEIGDENLLMIGTHVAHDVKIGAHVTIANGVQLAGHVVVEDYVTFGGLAAVQQFARIGESAFIAAGSMVERNVLPFVIVQGDRARVRGINRVGLQRRGVPEESIAALLRAYRDVFLSSGTVRERAEALLEDDPYVAALRRAALGA